MWCLEGRRGPAPSAHLLARTWLGEFLTEGKDGRRTVSARWLTKNFKIVVSGGESEEGGEMWKKCTCKLAAIQSCIIHVRLLLSDSFERFRFVHRVPHNHDRLDKLLLPPLGPQFCRVRGMVVQQFALHATCDDLGAAASCCIPCRPWMLHVGVCAMHRPNH